MSSRTIRWAVGLAVLALVTGAMLVAGVARGPQRAGAATTPALGGPPPGAPLDHFVCYHVTQSSNQAPPAGAVVKLSDEFNVNATTNQQVPKQVTVGPVVKLCNPISKYHAVAGVLFAYPVVHPTLHLVCFRVTERTPTPAVTVSTDNQFNNAGDTRILTTQTLTATSKQTVTSMCLPSHKSLTDVPPTGEPLDALSHFKCYKAKETEPAGTTVPGLPATIWAQDQFTPSPIPKSTVVAPVEVCNPATKSVTLPAGGTQTFPAVNTDLHLVCFSYRSTVTPPSEVFVDDQFTTAGTLGGLVLGAPFELCAPSFKQIIPPPPGG
jgi:hypothetical protein